MRNLFLPFSTNPTRAARGGETVSRGGEGGLYETGEAKVSKEEKKGKGGRVRGEKKVEIFLFLHLHFWGGKAEAQQAVRLSGSGGRRVRTHLHTAAAAAAVYKEATRPASERGSTPHLLSSDAG